VWGRRDSEQHIWEATRGRLLVGVALGLTAALCQAVATLMLKPLMAAGVDAVVGSAVRLSAALALHVVVRALRYPPAQLNAPLQLADLRNTFFSAAIPMVLGMTLILLALQNGQANLVGMFSSVSPVFAFAHAVGGVPRPSGHRCVVGCGYGSCRNNPYFVALSGAPKGRKPQALQPVKAALTAAETRPISALPASRVFTAPMTLPMSPGPVAPSSVTMARTACAISAASMRWGR